MKTIRWLSSCLIFFSSCGYKSPYKDYIPTNADSLLHKDMLKRAWITIDAFNPVIRNGDLITRTGNDFTSESLRSLNQKDQTFSHCGIASIENDSVFVYHALGGDYNPDQKIKREYFKYFADPENNKGFGIYRFAIEAKTKQRLISIAHEYYQRGIMFDMDFDLESEDRMYCAEFVYKCFLNASEHSLAFHHSHIGQFAYIAVDDIFLHAKCQLIIQQKFK